jgi:hypothetical protein
MNHSLARCVHFMRAVEPRGWRLEHRQMCVGVSSVCKHEKQGRMYVDLNSLFQLCVKSFKLFVF